MLLSIGNIVLTYILICRIAGDRYNFAGTLTVVPDIASNQLPGAKADLKSRHKRGEAVAAEGVRKLKSLEYVIYRIAWNFWHLAFKLIYDHRRGTKCTHVIG